jgi:hypothetical protein
MGLHFAFRSFRWALSFFNVYHHRKPSLVVVPEHTIKSLSRQINEEYLAHLHWTAEQPLPR